MRKIYVVKQYTIDLAGNLRRRGWLVLGLLWAAALVLGYAGFARQAVDAGRPDRILDIAYRVIQLIPMNSGDVEGVNWQLDAARYLVPFLAAWTAIRTLLSLFRDRWQQTLIRFWSDHVIICGLSRKGWLLAQGFAERGNRVVVIEANEDHELIGACRERGILVLVGDATKADMLLRAGVLRACHLIVVTDDDGINTEISVRTQGLVRKAAQSGRKGSGKRAPLTCTLHLVDPQLHALVRTREMALEKGVPFRLELFNIFDRGASLLWNQFGPTVGGRDAAQPGGISAQTECPAAILVVGFGRFGESLVICAARDWYTRLNASHNPATGRLRIVVIDLEADWKCRALSLRYPQLASVCDLVPMKMNVRWPEFYEGAFLPGGVGAQPISAVFVCFDNDSLALRTGLAIRQRLLQGACSPMPVVVRMAEAGGLARLVEPGSDSTAAFANLHAFGLLDRTCTPEAILGGTHETLARGLHEAYIRQQQALGRTIETNPSMAGWELLPEVLRESNRAQADAVFHYLADLGYTLIPLTDWSSASFRFAEYEVARLAEWEHARFVSERRSRGWRTANGSKNTGAQVNPTLVSWDELPEEEKIKTRDTMRELPLTLARAGFQIVRLSPAGKTTTTEN